VPVIDAIFKLAFSVHGVPMLLGLPFAFVTLLLAGIGVYGVLAYPVAQRRHELSIRVALGSSPREVCGIVVRDGTLMTVAGIVLGLVGALAVTRSIAGMLYGVQATDPRVIATVGLLLVTVACIAIVIPAGRAARVDPMAALRD